MVKTLRITGVAAVAFAGLVLASVLGPVSWIHFSDKSDERIGKVLASPGAVERFHELHGDEAMGKPDTPPLVVQAEAFKNIIDPPIVASLPTKEAVATAARTVPLVKPKETSAKFTLIGTSCSPTNPNLSFAYVRFTDDTYQWLQCGSPVGHLLIKEVREDSILCWDGSQESEILMETPPERVNLLDSGDAAVSTDVSPAAQPVEVKATAAAPANSPRLPKRPGLRQPPMTPPRVNPEEQAALSDLAAELRRSRNIPDGPGSIRGGEQAAIEKAIAEFKSSRVPPQEVQKLENLGDDVFDGNDRPQDDLNRERMRRLNSSRAMRN